MTKFIAHSAVGDESKHNPHWKTQYYQCGICTIDYDFITRLENAEEETRWILEFLDLTGTALNMDHSLWSILHGILHGGSVLP